MTSQVSPISRYLISLESPAGVVHVTDVPGTLVRLPGGGLGKLHRGHLRQEDFPVIRST